MFNNYFKELKGIVNSNDKQADMDAAIEKWKVDISDKFIDDILNKHGELKTENIPLALFSLCKSNNKAKTAVFCMLLEACCDDIPFIPPLENLRFHPEKLEFMYHTLATVYARCDNGIGDCMAFVILNNDPHMVVVPKQEKQIIHDATLRRIRLITDYFKEHGCENKEAVHSLAISLDLSTYINSPAINDELKRLAAIDLHPECKLFLLKTMAYNNIEGANKLVQELVDFDAKRLFTILHSIKKAELLENSGITQEKIAYSTMKNWLLYPTECGDNLDKLEYVDNFLYEDYLYYIYKFTCKGMEDNGYMIGVAGGYSQNELSTDLTGHTFSNFEPIGENYKQQAMDIIHLISDYWRKEADKAK